MASGLVFDFQRATSHIRAARSVRHRTRRSNQPQSHTKRTRRWRSSATAAKAIGVSTVVGQCGSEQLGLARVLRLPG